MILVIGLTLIAMAAVISAGREVGPTAKLWYGVPTMFMGVLLCLLHMGPTIVRNLKGLL